VIAILKLSSNTTYSEEDIYQKAINEKWIGNGTSEEPFIIESSHSFSDSSVIKNTSLHILIRNCEFNLLSLRKCKNFKFERCEFEVLGLSKCSEMSVKNCSFKHSLEIRFGHNLQIQNSHIPFLIFSMCYENYFKTCTIAKIFNYFSRANIFENINPAGGFNLILRESLKKYYLRSLGLITVGVISLFSAFIIYYNSYTDSVNWTLVGGLGLMAFFAIIISLALYLDSRKMKHHPDNQIYEKSSGI